MRRARTALVVLVLAVIAAAAGVALAGPSVAGGPTSVLLVDPGTGRATALYASDTRYTALAGLVGAFASPTDEREAGTTGEPAALGSTGGITLTWLMHDVHVWRVDRVYPDAVGGPWIATQTDLTGAGPGLGDDPVWHRSAYPERLGPLLDELGVGVNRVVAPVAAPQPSVARPVAAQPDRETATTSSSGPLGPAGWGLGGLVTGALLALGVTARRRRPDVDDATVPEVEAPTGAEVVDSRR